MLNFYTVRSSWIDNAIYDWSLDFTDYNKAVANAKNYDKSRFDNYDVLQSALDIDVTGLRFTQEELDSVTKIINDAINQLEVKETLDISSVAETTSTTTISTTTSTTSIAKPTNTILSTTSTSKITTTTASTSSNFESNTTNTLNTSTTAPTPTTTSVTENHIASDDELCKWAINDYEGKTEQAGVSAEITSKSDDAYEITLRDKNGIVIDVYQIDSVTGSGSNSSDEAVDLPQTGNNSMMNLLIVFGAFMLIGYGGFAVKSSGFIRRKEEEQ